MRKGEYRARIQRFLTGTFNSEDLSRVFLFLRENSYGHQTVYDIGNMIGHGDSRTKGISVKRVSDFYEITQFKVPLIGAYPNDVLNLNDAPPRLIEVMEATFGLLEDHRFSSDVGLSRAQVSTSLARIKRNFALKSNGNLEYTGPILTDRDSSVIRCLTSYLVAKPAYTDNEIYDETRELLLRHKSMGSEQEHLLLERNPHLTLFSIAAMHGVKYRLKRPEFSGGSYL